MGVAQITGNVAGSVLVIAATTAWGNHRANVLARRVQTLNQLELALDVLATEVAGGKSSIPSAFDRIAAMTQGPVRKVFSAAHDAAVITSDPGKQLCLHLETIDLSLRPDDTQVLKMLSSYLMLADSRELIKHIKLARERLRVQLAHARDHKRRYETLFRYLGPLAGIGMVVLFL